MRPCVAPPFSCSFYFPLLFSENWEVNAVFFLINLYRQKYVLLCHKGRYVGVKRGNDGAFCEFESFFCEFERGDYARKM